MTRAFCARKSFRAAAMRLTRSALPGSSRRHSAHAAADSSNPRGSENQRHLVGPGQKQSKDADKDLISNKYKDIRLKEKNMLSLY